MIGRVGEGMVLEIRSAYQVLLVPRFELVGFGAANALALSRQRRGSVKCIVEICFG